MGRRGSDLPSSAGRAGPGPAAKIGKGADVDHRHLFHRPGPRVVPLPCNRRGFPGGGCLEHAGGGGPSRPGEDTVRPRNEIGIAIDPSHGSERATLRAAERSTRPVFVTRAPAAAPVNPPRNLSAALPERGFGEAEPRAFPGADLPWALDAARTL